MLCQVRISQGHGLARLDFLTRLEEPEDDCFKDLKLGCPSLYHFIPTYPSYCRIVIDGSFIKNKIGIKPIYITLRNLDSSVSGKAMAWRVLGILPCYQKCATPNESDAWRRQRRLEMHHACILHLVDSLNNFCYKDVHVQCADGKV